MANTKSIDKISNYLEEKETPSMISDICIDLGLTKKTVLSVLDVLKKYRDVQILSNGKTTIVKLNNELQNE